MTRDFFDVAGNPYTRIVSKVLPASASGEFRGTIGPGMYNQGEYAALNEAGNVLALLWGHNHDNTFVLKRAGCMDMINTPCTGFGSYGDADIRGARVILLDEKDLNTYETYVVFYQGFYGSNTLYDTRVTLFNTYNTWANLIDIVSFRPLLWLIGLFA